MPAVYANVTLRVAGQNFFFILTIQRKTGQSVELCYVWAAVNHPAPSSGQILEKSLRLLFSSHDVTAVRRFVTRQFEKLHRDAVSVTDLLFAQLKREHVLKHGTAREVDGRPAKLVLT